MAAKKKNGLRAVSMPGAATMEERLVCFAIAFGMDPVELLKRPRLKVIAKIPKRHRRVLSELAREAARILESQS